MRHLTTSLLALLTLAACEQAEGPPNGKKFDPASITAAPTPDEDPGVAPGLKATLDGQPFRPKSAFAVEKDGKYTVQLAGIGEACGFGYADLERRDRGRNIETPPIPFEKGAVITVGAEQPAHFTARGAPVSLPATGTITVLDVQPTSARIRFDLKSGNDVAIGDVDVGYCK